MCQNCESERGRVVGLEKRLAAAEECLRHAAREAEARAEKAEAALRDIADCQHRYVQTGYASEVHDESECGPCIARAFLGRATDGL